MSKSDDLFREVAELEKKVDTTTFPPDLKEKTLAMFKRLTMMARTGEYATEYERVAT